jgi:superfamily II DNA or RNA helicase
VIPLNVTVDTHLRFDPTGTGPAGAKMCFTLAQALTVGDPDESDEPPVIMWGQDHNGNFIAPRGFAVKLVKGFRHFGFEPIWIDNRVLVPASIPQLTSTMSPRTYQGKAISHMVGCMQGIYEAPPAAGKTISAAFFISQIQQRSIILVDKINIATQWRKRIFEALGYEAGLIGDGVWDERDITVVLRQTLWNSREELDRTRWWDRWGAVILDECHAISALTVRELMQRFAAYYRIGLSATPDRHGWMTLLSRSIIGEIFCRTTDRELEEAGVLVRPRVIAVRTPFEWDWKRKLDGKMQWQKMIKDLKFDPGRNALFRNLCSQQRGYCCLVITAQTSHASELAAYALSAGWPDEAVMIMTGAQDDDERQRIIDRAAHGDCIIFSTIGKEALDIPRLDRLFLVWPDKLDYAIRQGIGRVKRIHDEKTEPPIVYDFYDDKVPILRQHFSERRGAYARAELDLTIT